MTRHVVPFAISEGVAFQQYIVDPRDLGDSVAVNNDNQLELDGAHPLLVVRHPSRNDDSRTMVATALPSSGYVHNKGYIHAVRHEPSTSTQDLLALLAYLNSFTCDWWVRRFVDRHVTAPVLNNIRLPDWGEDEITRAADLAAGRLLANQAGTLAGGRKLESTTEDRSEQKVRPLGASPNPARAARAQLNRALEGHARTLEEDRDLLGFSVEADSTGRRLVEWLRSGKVEVRRLEDAFLHGKAFIVDSHDEGVIAGSSNFTYAGLATNIELNLGQYQPHVVGQVKDWYEALWSRAQEFDLAGMYASRFDPHPP